ncbi:MAG: hypothetical protein A2Y24_01190 [Clostridiales bacterium GWE2_32_10]|nr:MAG: hypothetical protein A2Y24_01190 [Clostridiales bacterium GWE2_32_10]HBY21253.1 hypothetical protein [Clostridiales bacterium]
MLKIHRLYICLIINFILLVNISVSHAENNIPTISAEASIVYCINTNQILYEKNIYEKHFPASITKVMTAMLAIEHNKLDDVITYSDTAVNSIERNSSHLWVVSEEQLTVANSLYGLLLKSANEIANGLAEKTSGSIDKFVNLMNTEARSLGCKDTHFTNTNGLPNDNHYTTAYDMALISADAFKSSTFREIISTKLYTIPATNKNTERIIANEHKMFQNTKFHYDYCLGGKTGYTIAAGHTLVTFAEKDGMQLVSVILKSDSKDFYLDAINTLDYAFNNYKLVTLLKEKQSTKKIPVFEGINVKDNIDARTSKELTFVVPIDSATTDIKAEYNLPSKLDKSISAGEKLGTVKYYYDNKVIAYTELFADKTVAVKKSILDFKDGFFIGLMGLIFMLIVFIFKGSIILVLILALLLILAKIFKFKIKIKNRKTKY